MNLPKSSPSGSSAQILSQDDHIPLPPVPMHLLIFNHQHPHVTAYPPIIKYDSTLQWKSENPKIPDDPCMEYLLTFTFYPIDLPNLGKYTIHGSPGIEFQEVFPEDLLSMIA